MLYVPESEIESVDEEFVVAEEEVTPEADIVDEPIPEMVAEAIDEPVIAEESQPAIEEETTEEREEEFPAGPILFVPQVDRPQPPTQPVSEEPEEDLDLELLELEEKLRELEIEEQERVEAEREAAELEALEQDIDSDELWALPGEFEVATEAPESGLRFAETSQGTATRTEGVLAEVVVAAAHAATGDKPTTTSEKLGAALMSPVRHLPMRTCVLCGDKNPKQEMLRHRPEPTSTRWQLTNTAG